MADKSTENKTRRKPQGPRQVYVVITAPEGVQASDIKVHYAGGNAGQVLEVMEGLRKAGQDPSYSKVEAPSASSE